MSSANGSIVDQSEEKSGNVAGSVRPGIESSRDSSESSSSQSQSGSDEESGESTGSSSDKNDQQDGSVDEQSEHSNDEVSGSEKSIESYKSFNTSVVKSAHVTSEVSDQVTTPAKVASKSSGKAVKAKSPVAPTPKAAEVPLKAESSDEVKPGSPVPITPAKSLVLASPPPVHAIDFADIGRVNQPIRKVDESKHELSPGECSEQEVVGSKVASTSKTTESEASRKRSRNSSRVSKKEMVSPKVKRTKKEKKAKSEKAVDRQSKSVEKVQQQVKLLQAQLDEVRSSGVRPVKRVKKAVKHKSVKTKKSKQRASDAEGSPSSESSEGPTTSSRIAKIPMGRKLQGLAMERAKQVGTVRQGEVHSVEIVNALRAIMTTTFLLEPTQAYRDFNFVPGTGLEHIQKHLSDLQEDLGVFLCASAKLNLELAREQDAAKKLRINSDANNEFLCVWQFTNDLARATATVAKPIVAPGQIGAVGPVDNKVADKDHDKSGAGDKVKAIKKKKASTSKAEEQE